MPPRRGSAPHRLHQHHGCIYCCRAPVPSFGGHASSNPTSVGLGQQRTGCTFSLVWQNSRPVVSMPATCSSVHVLRYHVQDGPRVSNRMPETRARHRATKSPFDPCPVAAITEAPRLPRVRHRSRLAESCLHGYIHNSSSSRRRRRRHALSCGPLVDKLSLSRHDHFFQRA